MSSRLFDKSIRKHIYAIYGMVRIADEIVDSYQGNDKMDYLDIFEDDVYTAITSGYSTNPLLHAFGDTSRRYSLEQAHVQAFFESMRIDVDKKTFTQDEYEAYIYGSAEVIGLMCLKVFVNGDSALYRRLEPGARALGAAYQKVNFLRDMGQDYRELGRVYFPGVDYDQFDEQSKQVIVADIKRDFEAAKRSIDQLPVSARKAVAASYAYYYELFLRLIEAETATIKSTRVRVPNQQKLYLLAKAWSAKP